MIDILNLIVPLFLIIFTAALAKKIFAISEQWTKVLNEYALYVGLPVLIFSALNTHRINYDKEAQMILANSLFILCGLLMGFAITKALKLNKKDSLTLIICLSFSNIAYLGIPLITSVYGYSILPSLSLIVAIYIFWQFSVGMSVLEYEKNIKQKKIFRITAKKIILNPLLLAVIISLTYNAIGIAIPTILKTSLDMISESVTPIVLIIIGLFLGKMHTGKIKEWIAVSIFSITTTIIMPALFYFSIILLQKEPKTFDLSILQAAMPLAITPFALAENYNLNKEFIARSIMVSTIISPITLSLWIGILS